MNFPKSITPNKTPKTVEQNVNDISRISLGAAIRGDLYSSTDIRVDGQVDGTLFSEGKIVVGEAARLSGKMFCTNVDFWGKMDGDIFVKDTLSLKSTSVVNGNIHVRKIQVEMGAQINGSIKMITEKEYEQLLASTVNMPANVSSAIQKPVQAPRTSVFGPRPAAAKPAPAAPKPVAPKSADAPSQQQLS